jgi:hypothetical protein
MIRFREMHGIFWTLKGLARIALALAAVLALVALAPLGAFGQGSRKDDIVFNSRGTPLAGATVRVCTMPASGQPCTPLALIYSDVALTQALANPTATDGLGNYFFYAAPGKYEIEISGPAIATKQIPNVILPSDPTSPTFATLSTTSGITAFSLTLTGNLTATGSVNASGNLSGNTFTLNNQSAPPGASSAGTVTVYTKAADKRLYYKDDTGAEIGPIANTTGAQTNVTNTFTASQNFDAGFAGKGPSPWYDITRYGGASFLYPPQTTTGTITAASTSLSLGSAIDFQNGQGIVIYKAGPATTLQTPIAPTVTPVGILNGVTTYNYQVVGEDFNGGLTPASPTGSTTVGASALGVTSATLLSASRTSGVLTFTTSAPHNFGVGITVAVTGAQTNASSSFECNGTLTIVATPTSTTFTVSQNGRVDNASVCTGGTAAVNAGNKLTWFTSGNPSITTQNNVIRWWIYRNSALVGVASGADTYYVDYGYGLTGSQVPGYVPSTPPASATPGYLATTISSGGGTTTLTLAASATTTATGQTVSHDTSPAILAAVNAAIANGGGTVYIPPVTESSNNLVYPINSTLVLPSSGGNYIRLLFNGGVFLFQSVVLGSSYAIEGIPGSGSFGANGAFGDAPYVVFATNTTPSFYAICKTGISFKNIFLNVNQNQQVGILLGGNSSPCGNAQISFTDTYVGAGGTGDEPLRVTGGGFGFYFLRGGMTQGQPSNAAFANPGMHFTTMFVQQASGQNPGNVYAEQTFLDQQGVRLDNDPTPTFASGGSQWVFKDIFYESTAGPLMRVSEQGNISVSQFSFIHVAGADSVVGAATPVFDLTNSNTLISFLVENVSFGGSAPLFAGASGGSLSASILNPPSLFIGLASGYTMLTSASSGGPFIETTAPVTMRNNPPLLWPLATPAAPAATVQAGGSLAVGTYFYYLSAVDVDGLAGDSAGNPVGDSLASFASNSCVTTTGNQKCALTWTTVPNAAGYRVWRATNAGGNPSGFPSILVAGGATASFTDDGTATTICCPSALGFTNAGSVKLRQTGVILNGENISAAPRGIHNVFLPGALTSTWTGATLTLDKAITVTRVQVQAKTAPSGCATNAVVRLTDGASPLNVTLSSAANDSGVLSQNYAAGAVLTVSVQTAASGCTASPADANVVVQYRMQ